MKNSLNACRILLLLVFLFFPVSAIHGQQTATPPTPHATFVFSPADTVIYVSHFELDAQNFQADEGRTKIVQRPGIIEGPRKKAQDPATQAKKTVDQMAADIVNDLKKAGFKAERMGTTDARPSTGVWVHGVFTELDEGNRLHRAVITMNPYVAAAKFVMEKNAPEKTLKKTASEISAEIIKRLKEHEAAPVAK